METKVVYNYNPSRIEAKPCIIQQENVYNIFRGLEVHFYRWGMQEKLFVTHLTVAIWRVYPKIIK